MKDKKIQIYKTRTRILIGFFILILALVTARFFYLQIIQGNELKELRERNINAFEYIYPKRGRILSKDGIVLAEDRKVFSLAIDIEQKPSEQSINKLADLYPDKIKVENLRLKVRNSIKFRRPAVSYTHLTLPTSFLV